MIKRGVSLYSYQQEQFFKRMTLRDMVKEVHDNLKTDGIEIIDQAVVRQYPYPSDEFVAEFRDLMAEFDMTAVTMDIYLDTLQFRDHVMTHKEAAERLVRDIRLAAKLGFQNVRCLCSVPIDVIEMALPAAEEYGVRIGKEIHAPFNIKTDSGEQYGKGDGFPRNPKMCEEIINLAEKKHTKFVGLVPDMGIFQRSINRPQFAYAVRHGANPDALRMVDRIAAEGVRDPAVARERLLALGFSEKDTTVARQVGMFSQVDPREMRDIVPYIVSIHGKFYEMTEIPGRTEEYEDVAIDYKNPIYWLKQGGYEGYICINRRPGKLPHVSDNAIDWERYIENRKSSVRCKAEHAFRIIKCQFGYKKTVYRGLLKNANRLYALFACANLYALAMAGRKLSTT